MPYLFASRDMVSSGDAVSSGEAAEGGPSACWRDFEPAAVVLAYREGAELSHYEYFRLCLSAHYLTCATPVPTDVDNQIRQRLWPEGLPLSTALEMGTLVFQSRSWDFTRVSGRVCWGASGSEWERTPLHGHFGEWFTVATAAYAALGRYRAAEAKTLRAGLLEAIVGEVEREGEVFASCWRAQDGVEALRASATVAHNFGDLDRVMDMWELPVEDPLRLGYYKLTTTPYDLEGRLRYKGRLWVAGELYKAPIAGSSMAAENHRHFALRKPRAIREHPSLRVPVGPFFDEWGARVVTLLDADRLEEVVAALLEGWSRLEKTFRGYGRALHALVESRPTLREDPRLIPLYRDAVMSRALRPSRAEFETEWASRALDHLDAIPARA